MSNFHSDRWESSLWNDMCEIIYAWMISMDDLSEMVYGKSSEQRWSQPLTNAFHISFQRDDSMDDSMILHSWQAESLANTYCRTSLQWCLQSRIKTRCVIRSVHYSVLYQTPFLFPCSSVKTPYIFRQTTHCFFLSEFCLIFGVHAF